MMSRGAQVDLSPSANTGNEAPGQFFHWTLFDFANSFLYTNIALYFPQWLTIDRGVSDLAYNAIFVAATILLLFSAPIAGALADRVGNKVAFLRGTSVAMFLATAAIGLATIPGVPNTVGTTIGIVAFFVVNYSYQLSLLFYDSMMGDVVRPQRYMRASGLGLAAGWFGAICGILIVYPVAQGALPLVPGGRIPALLAANIAFALLVVLPLCKLRSPKRQHSSTDTKGVSLRSVAISPLRELRAIWVNPLLRAFLIAYWLYIDAILTLQENITIYMERVYAMPDSEKAKVALGIIVVGAIAAVITSFVVPVKRAGRVLVATLITCAIGFFALGLSRSMEVFIATLLGLAFCFGMILTMSRALYTHIVPAAKRTEYFGFYAIAQRSSSLIGPLLWGGAVSLSAGSAAQQYGFAAVTLGVLVTLSIWPAFRFSPRLSSTLKPDHHG